MEHEKDRRLTRREMIQIVGVSGITASFAGCTGNTNSTSSSTEAAKTTNGRNSSGDVNRSNGGNGDSGPQTAGDQQLIEKNWTGVLTKPGKSGQHNPWGKNYNFDGFFLYDHLGRYHDGKQKFIGFVADNWNIDGKTATVHLRDSYTWHNGDDVTAQDLVTQLDIESLLGSPFDTIKSYEATDKKTVKFHLTKPANKFMLLMQLLPRRLQAKESIYGKFAKQARKADSKSKKKSVINNIKKFKLHFGSDKRPIGNGPWKFKSMSNQAWTFELYKDYNNGHFKASDRNFDLASWRYVPKKTKRALALANDKVDYWTKTHPTQSQLNQQPKGVSWNAVPVYNGYGIVPNFNKKPWDDRRVRQAILYALDFGLVAKNTSGAYQRDPIKIPCGIANSVLDKYLGDHKSKYSKYQKNQQKAAKLLKDAGFTKKSGTWHKPDGSKFSPTLKEGRGGYWVSIDQNVVSQLKSFGIDMSLQNVDHTQMYGEVVPNGNFEIMGDWWSGIWGHGGYPGFHIRAVTLGYWGQQTSYPKKAKVPTPIGKPNGSLETWDVKQVFNDLLTAQDKQSAQKLNRKVAWLYNMTLPKMPVTIEHDVNLFDTKNWQLPDLDGELMKQEEPHWWADRMGKVHAKTK